MNKLGIKPILIIILLINSFLSPFTNAQSISHSTTQINQISEYALYSQNYVDVLPHQIEGQAECVILISELQRGAAKDAIRSIDNPIFVNPDHDTAPDDLNQKVIGVVYNGTARAYPYNILNWHEIVNDDFSGDKVSITYCPLTGSGIVYPTKVLNDTELGTSGLLYENNLVFYERDIDTHWSQMGGFPVKGKSYGRDITYTETVETTWGTWLKLHPNTKVLSTNTGMTRSYDRYPYGAYQSDSSIYFPTIYDRDIEPYNLYHEKELTHIIQTDGQTLLLPSQELNKIPVLNHNFVNNDLVTFYLESEKIILTYSAKLNGTTLNFTSYTDQSNAFSSDLTLDLPLVIDNLDNIWNFNGLAISGPSIGSQLELVPTYNAFWFAAISFYYDQSILIIDNGEINITTTEIIETIISDGVTIESTKTVTSNVHSSFSVDPEVQEEDYLPLSSFFVLALFTLTILRINKRKSRI